MRAVSRPHPHPLSTWRGEGVDPGLERSIEGGRLRPDTCVILWLMNTRKAITLRLEGEDYARLEQEANQLGLHPATLARVYVRAGLVKRNEGTIDKQHQSALEALEYLAQLTADLPAIDAVRIARESRDELEQRRVSWCQRLLTPVFWSCG